MRISTTQLFGLNVQQMNDQQSELAQLYQQIASGQAITTPSDNPLGASQAVQLSMQASELSQYTSNQSTALTSLHAEDSTLSSVSTVLQSVNTQLVHAGDASLSDSNRGAIAQDLIGLKNQLLGLANANDGQGNYLFAGFQTTSQPFSTNAAGTVSYNGDTGVRSIQVTSSHQVAVSDSGASVFLSVAAVGTTSISAGSASNTGTGVVGTVSTLNASNPANQDKYTITFAGSGASSTYTITDNTTGTTGAAQPYSAGSAITLGGQSVSITGAPAAGDTFTVTPATQAGTDIFSSIDAAIAALQTPVVGTAGSANLSNSLSTAMQKVQNAMNNVVTVQASVGGREQELQALQTVTQNSSLQTQSNLSGLTQINLTSTISKYTMTQYALQAAQQGFVKIQGMSLFNYIN